MKIPKASPTAIALLMAIPIDSAWSAEDATLELENLVVTAALEPIAADQVAGSLTVITAEDIEKRQAVFLSDLLRTVPGFAVSQSGGPGAQTQVRVRGSEANHVLVLVDGMRVNDPASADEFQFQYLLGEQIARVEILRGPQSATWGTDALSAVINIIHHETQDRPKTEFSAESGSWDSRKLSLQGSFGSDAYRAWAGLTDYETDGINASRTGGERDGNSNTTVNGGVSFQLAEAVSLNFSGRRLEAENEFDDFDFATGLPADADRRTEVGRTYWQASVRVAPDDRPWSGTLNVNALDSDNQNFADGSWSGSTAADSLEFAARLSFSPGSQQDQAHRVTLAVDRQEIDFSQRGIATAFGDPNQDQSYDVSGIALEYFARPADQFNWSLSGRLDDFSDFDSVRTWQLASSYRFDEKWRLRGSLGTGSKAPTFTERFGFFDGSFKGNPALKPERSSGWELGIEGDVLDGAAQLSMSWFDHDLEDEIEGFVFDPASGLFTAVNKLNDSQRSGFELGLRTLIGDSLELGFSYSYTDAKQTDLSGVSSREIRRPEHMGSFNLNYPFADKRGNLNFALRYNGEQFDSFFSPLTFMSEQVILAEHLVGDLALAWKLSPALELTARVENLFDEQYEEVLGFARPGRAVYAGLRARFGYSDR